MLRSFVPKFQDSSVPDIFRQQVFEPTDVRPRRPSSVGTAIQAMDGNEAVELEEVLQRWEQALTLPWGPAPRRVKNAVLFL